MKLKTSIILSSLVVATAMPAVADSVWDMYIGASIGTGARTIFQPGADDTHSAQSLGGVFGIDVPYIRAELEYNYLREYDSRANIGMFNAYFKIPLVIVKPYVGLGFGMLFDGRDSKQNIDFDTALAYQAMIGVTLDVPKLPFKFDIEARSLYAPDVYKYNGATPDMLQYEARIKLRYLF